MTLAQPQTPLNLLPSWPDPRQQFDYSLKSLDITKPCPGAAFRYVELFAGIGGFRLALDKLGGTCVFSNEIDKDATDVYRRNFVDSDSCLVRRPIEEIDAKEIPPFDIMTAGFPCQPFSRLGAQPAFQDEKGQLFFQIVRIVHHHQPRAILLENVPGLLHADDGRVLNGVLSELSALGYRVGATTVNSNAFLPQCRRRVYFVAVKNSESHFPSHPLLPSLNRHLKAVLDPNPDSSHLLTNTRVLATERKMHRYLARKGRKLDKPSKPNETVKGGAEHWIRTWEEGLCPCSSLYAQSHTLISSYAKGLSETQLVPAPCFDPQHCCYASPQPPSSCPCAGPTRRPPRTYTARECARLQGFPETFQFSDAGIFSWYRCIGNAVGPPVIAALAGPIVCALFHKNQCTHPGLRAALALAVESSPDCEALPEKLVQLDSGFMSVREMLAQLTPQDGP